MYHQPDFKSEKSLLEQACKARGFRALFLPKFHCELNFLEQCWGASKHVYRLNPASSKEEDLERNVVNALDPVSLKVMRRFVQILLVSTV
jgi:transposase